MSPIKPIGALLSKTASSTGMREISNATKSVALHKSGSDCCENFLLQNPITPSEIIPNADIIAVLWSMPPPKNSVAAPA